MIDRGQRDSAALDDAEVWAGIEAGSPLPPDDPAFEANAIALSEDSSERILAQTDRRRGFLAAYAWSVPTRPAVEAIAAYAAGDQVLEICAGSGLWAQLLASAGAGIIATDAAEGTARAFWPVEQLDAEAAVRTHPECRLLFVCWPPMASDCATRALTLFKGDRLVFAGDERFTADTGFHTLVVRDWMLDEEILLPSWPGIDDRARLYHRVPRP